MADRSRRRRVLRLVPLAVGFLAVGGVVGWAAQVVFTPNTDVLDEDQHTYVEVVDGEVGSSLTLNASAEWAASAAASNLAAGTVTTVNVSAGQEVGQGTVLYTVDLRPVVIAEGAIPSFAELQQGSDNATVAQLQQMLTDLGFYSGLCDGEFGPATTRAVRAWQKSLGTNPDGVVHRGDLLFVPALPTRVALDDTIIRRGGPVSGGEPVISALGAEPSFVLAVTEDQAALIAGGTRVEITSPSGSKWEASTGDASGGDGNSVTIKLVGRDGGGICAGACGEVPPTGKTLLPSQVVTVEPVSGPLAPTAAIFTDAAGHTSVVDSVGKRHEVKILASAQGMAILDGISTGVRLQVPAAEN